MKVFMSILVNILAVSFRLWLVALAATSIVAILILGVMVAILSFAWSLLRGLKSDNRDPLARSYIEGSGSTVHNAEVAQINDSHRS